jgi:hypothetical protein
MGPRFRGDDDPLWRLLHNAEFLHHVRHGVRPTRRHRRRGFPWLPATTDRRQTAPIVTGYVIAITTSFDAAFVIAGAMMLLGAGSALFVANRPMQTRTAEEPAVSLVP